MQIKCDYCGNFIEENEETCPCCGAPNNHVNRSAKEAPETIEELKEWVRRHNIPIDKFRFFIGEDYREPKAFGIYKDGKGDFVVYKNKADGSRAIRYNGKDEKYAVNELYQKLKSQIADYKAFEAEKGRHPHTVRENKKKRRWVFILVLIIVAIIVISVIDSRTVGWQRRPYLYNGSTYYYNSFDNVWYNDDYDIIEDVPYELQSSPEEFKDWDDSYSDSGWDDDSDYNWDSGSDWDFDFDFDFDWDSDW